MDARKKKKIAIIGAGVSGIVSIACLKEEGCFEPICFEASDKYGGVWNYREESIDGFASLMPRTIQNHSKEMGAFSNFPPKKEHNNFMHHKEYLEYLTEYYKKHGCYKHIRFQSEVIEVKKSDDYEDTGHFSVSVKDTVSGEITTDIFDGVMVCTGHFSFPKMEKFPGLDKFKGKIIHTHSLKHSDEFANQNVLVIGTGCSGLDAAEDISLVAKQVYLSARSGMFVLSRTGAYGYPIDYLMHTRYKMIFFNSLPYHFSSWFFETFYLDEKFDQNLYHIKPKYHFLAKDIVLNETIHTKLISGAVIQKGSVKFFVKNGVVFEGEDTVTKIDSVIMATGYTLKFPFLVDELLQKENGRLNLYKCMYPTQLPHSTLVFMGLINPFGGGIPLLEMQCRWAALVFSGKRKLPSNSKMLEDAIKRHEVNEKCYTPSEYMSIRVQYVSYLDEIAIEVGVRPNLLKYIFLDFPLFCKLLFGASVPYQYRLEGPHSWKGARQAIMECEERVRFPLSRRNTSERNIFIGILKYIIKLLPDFFK